MTTEISQVSHLHIEPPGPCPCSACSPSVEPGRWARTLAHRPRWRPVIAAAVAVALLGVEGVIFAESWGGLVGFAHLIGIHSGAARGVPVTLDGVAVIASLIALRAELAGESSALARLVLFTFTGASASANAWHGWRSGGIGAALYFGGMSLAVAVVFALVLREIRRDDRRAAGRVTNRLPKFSAAHWLRWPRLTWRAWSLSVRDGHGTPHAAFAAAMADELPALDLAADVLATLAPRDRLTAAFGAVGALDVPRALALLDQHGCPVDQSHAYQIRKALTRPDGSDR